MGQLTNANIVTIDPVTAGARNAGIHSHPNLFFLGLGLLQQYQHSITFQNFNKTTPVIQRCVKCGPDLSITYYNIMRTV